MSGSYKERLTTELSELREKIEKLEWFLTTDTFKNLDHLNRSLLISQLSVMYTYDTILDMRIEGVPKELEL